MDALGEAFAWHAHAEARAIGRAGLVGLCQAPFGDWPVPPAARDGLPLNGVLLDADQCPTDTLTRLAARPSPTDAGSR